MKNKPSAFVIFIPGFPKDEKDSTCLPAQQQFVKGFKERFPSLKLIVIAFQYPFEAKRYLWHGATVVSFGGKNRGGLSRLLLWSRVRKYFKDLQADHHVKGLLSFWLGESCLVARSLARKYRLPHYCWLMGQDARAENKYVRRSGISPNELIAISDFTAGELDRNHGIRPKHIIPLGIGSGIAKDSFIERDIDVLSVGSLIPLKHFELVVELAARLRAIKKDLKVVICGSGPEEENLRGLIKTLRLESNVHLSGEQKHSDVIALMHRSRLLVHPSSYEGFSGVCLEAIACGCQVISFVQPMSHPIDKWTIVKDDNEMFGAAKAFLSAPTDTRPVIPFPIEQTVERISGLFNL